MSQFNYCQLVWISYYRTETNKINRLHKRCLRLIYNDKKSSLEELLEINSSVSIQDRYLGALGTKMCHIYHEISTSITKEIFTIRHQNQYNFRNWSDSYVAKIRYFNHGSVGVRYLDPQVYKIMMTTDKSKIALKRQKPESCLS